MKLKTTLSTVILTMLTSPLLVNIASAIPSSTLATNSKVNPVLIAQRNESQRDTFINKDVIEEVPLSPQELKKSGKKEIHRKRALRKASRQIGYRERPMGSNCNKFSRYFGYRCQQWCADFVSWAYDSTSDKNKKVAWGYPSAVSNILSWAQKNKRLVKNPKPGDIFILKGPGVSHAGLVRRVRKGTFTTVEGNTSNRVRSLRRPLSSRYRFVRTTKR